MATERTRSAHPETMDLLSTASEIQASTLEYIFLANRLTTAFAACWVGGSLETCRTLAEANVRATGAVTKRDDPRDDERLPIEDYDRLGVEEISRRLGPLDAAEVGRLRRYERRHEKRAALMERFDRSLV